MQPLTDIQKSADQLSLEDRVDLATYILASLPHPPLGADDDEVCRRDEAMDSGIELPISHSQFLDEVGRQ